MTVLTMDTGSPLTEQGAPVLSVSLVRLVLAPTHHQLYIAYGLSTNPFPMISTYHDIRCHRALPHGSISTPSSRTYIDENTILLVVM